RPSAICASGPRSRSSAPCHVVSGDSPTHLDGLGPPGTRLHDLELEWTVVHLVANAWHAPDAFGHETSDRQSVGLEVLDVQRFEHLARLGPTAAQQAAVGAFGNERIDAVALVLDLSDDFLEHIFQSHQA